jgi:hypothetical protein
MMIAPSEILTSNGRLRRMVKSDSAAFSELNADPLVMEFFRIHALSKKAKKSVNCGLPFGRAARTICRPVVTFMSSPFLIVGRNPARSAHGTRSVADEGG